ncbi:Bax inhibitor-1/YccA family protein [Longispora albida]|uniref:Bax inhibitor-1/YccA family protein n=1 Tax=Longispora albida TaxID=203523 RepID=UPI000373DACA|nr:Bax inhibitor-1/YccA family protein [Longispora albida]
MKSSNGALGRVLTGAAQDRNTYAQPGYPAPYGDTGYAAPQVRTMTVDDVVIRTVFLLALTGITGAVSWLFIPPAVQGLALLASGVIGLVLALVIVFAQVTNPVVISAYAVIQGVAAGVVSKFYENLYDGIVLQAVVATFGVFFAMAVLYKFRVLRATPKFARGVIGALIGVVALMLINFVVGFFNDGGIGIRASADPSAKVSWLPIVFSLVVIVVAALTFILDFDQVEQGVRYGLPEKYAWACAFGLLVGLIFLYYEVLRLLSYLRR